MASLSQLFPKAIIVREDPPEWRRRAGAALWLGWDRPGFLWPQEVAGPALCGSTSVCPFTLPLHLPAPDPKGASGPGSEPVRSKHRPPPQQYSLPTVCRGASGLTYRPELSLRVSSPTQNTAVWTQHPQGGLSAHCNHPLAWPFEAPAAGSVLRVCLLSMPVSSHCVSVSCPHEQSLESSEEGCSPFSIGDSALGAGLATRMPRGRERTCGAPRERTPR